MCSYPFLQWSLWLPNVTQCFVSVNVEGFILESLSRMIFEEIKKLLSEEDHAPILKRIQPRCEAARNKHRAVHQRKLDKLKHRPTNKGTTQKTNNTVINMPLCTLTATEETIPRKWFKSGIATKETNQRCWNFSREALRDRRVLMESTSSLRQMETFTTKWRWSYAELKKGQI